MGGLEALKTLPAAQRRERLSSCCAARAWVEQLSGGWPYPEVDAVLAASDLAIEQLDPDDVAQALAAHPRIGQRAPGPSTEATWSRQEQAGVVDADSGVRAALHEGNLAYEERFGHVFLICASGRSAPDMLTALRERLGNEPDTEEKVVKEELRKITRLRLERLLT